MASRYNAKEEYYYIYVKHVYIQNMSPLTVRVWTNSPYNWYDKTTSFGFSFMSLE